MRMLFFIVAMLLTFPAFAQEESSTEEFESSTVVSQQVPRSVLQEAVIAYTERTGRTPRIGQTSMAAGRICRWVEFDIPLETPHPFRGQTLRIHAESSGCLESAQGVTINFVVDLRTRRITPVTRIEINTILGAIPELTRSASR